MKTLSQSVKILKVFRRVSTIPVHDSSQQMLDDLKTTETDLLIAAQKKEDEVRELYNSHLGFVSRSKKTQLLINRAATDEAIQELQTLRASADKLANFFHAAYTKEKATKDSLYESLKNVQGAKNKLTSLKDKATLDATLMSLIGSYEGITMEVEPEFDKREISRIVHTANALIELRTESR